jgi:hypothetical protein
MSVHNIIDLAGGEDVEPLEVYEDIDSALETLKAGVAAEEPLDVIFERMRAAHPSYYG